MGGARGRSYAIDGGIWYSFVSSRMDQLYLFKRGLKILLSSKGWRRCVDGDGSGGCGVETKVLAARGGEWCGGSSRSGWEECFWGSPKKLAEKVFRQRRWWPEGGGRRQEGRRVKFYRLRDNRFYVTIKDQMSKSQVRPEKSKARDQDYCCSKGSLGDKIICDLDKTLDLSQRSPQNCPKYGNPVDDSSEPSNDNTNVVNALQEPFVVEQDPDGNSFTYDSKSNIVHDSPNVFDPPPQPPLYSCEFCGNDARYGHYCTPQILACYDDDDDDDYTIAITHKEPDNSPSMGDEHLDTVPATESDKFIKSSVENLFPNPSESEGEYECDVPACEDLTTFSNILFDANYNFSSSDDQSLSDEDILKKICSNPLFDEEIIYMKIDPHHFNAESSLIESLLNRDSPVISSSSKIDSFFDEFTGELTLLKSISPGIDETDCDPEDKTRFIKRLLYDNSSPRPPEEFISENSDTAFESYSPSPIPVEDGDSLMEKIDLSFTPDYLMSSGIEEDDYDSERDILILEELLSNDSLSLPENDSFHFDIPSSSRPPVKPPDGNSGILNVKMIGDISEHRVPMPRLMSTLVPNQEKSPDLSSHLGYEAFQPSTECLMVIYGKNTPILDVLFFYFYRP
nr:hypothetical protein [Tanacetum cinerariifolium]